MQAGDSSQNCVEENRHRAVRQAKPDLAMTILNYQETNNISHLDMACILTDILATELRYANREDELRRTGFCHRMAGE